MQHSAVSDQLKRPHRLYTKPFTDAELKAKQDGEMYLQMARRYEAAGDRNNAVSCCLEGLFLTFGVSRPLAVRDQFDDLLRVIDPATQIASRIRSCMK